MLEHTLKKHVRFVKGGYIYLICKMDFSRINHKLPIEKLKHPVAIARGIDLRVLRLDKTHPEISGNKWFKLKYNLIEAKAQGISTLLTFGGAYSNHIYAVAEAAKLFGFKSIGVIRGEAHHKLNPTLQYATESGMHFKYVDREAYRHKTNPEFIDKLRSEFGDFYLIPEGGTNSLAIKGAAEIADSIDESFDYYCLSVGTGGTITGLINGLRNKGQVIGFSALKGSFLNDEVSALLSEYSNDQFNNWAINNDYHFGGYAKVKPELLDFIKKTEQELGLVLDPVYTGKMLYGVIDMISQGQFEPGTKILTIHTGGLQGRAGFGL